ncbi:hypothetical protein P691DRAFT_782554 [Macrolepiota fuliginosa MF-IS2]|uniref:Uncharacterized protein n=1 Tax=Macrolepiota fuliginosa MF-IS2 TaxID=1400762 RepID=A0A9P5WZ17_9AGAR|nr:hypothetical protein P691DRAFT_782554 [Macrolepiota fuliginosa MF-IS2]
MSAAVYVWDWDLEDNFVQELVLKSDREEMLEGFREQEKQYDPYFNKWDCCYEWGRDREDTPDSAGISYVNIQVPTTENAEQCMDSNGEQVQCEVLKTLLNHFRFVPPIPLPSSFTEFTSDSDFKSLISALGLHGIEASNDFFKMPTGKLCASFFRSFVGRSDKLLKPDLWDLSKDNRQTLCFSKHLSSIITMENGTEALYVFDFESSSTVLWKLGVLSASAALYVCCLPEGMSEEELAWELVQNGICFHTLQRHDTLDPAPTEKLAATMVPMRLSGHVFNKKDYDFYERQCQSLFSLRGGFVWRIASKYISFAEAVRGPWGTCDAMNETFIVKDSNGIEYIDNDLTDDKLEVLCGVYRMFTGVGMDIAKLLWYPLAGSFEGSSEDFG